MSTTRRGETTAVRRHVIRTPIGFVVNSFVASTVAIVLTRMIEQLGVAVWGILAGRQPYLSNLTTGFRAEGTDLVLLGGPIAVVIAGVWFLRGMAQSRRRTTQRLVLLWLSIHSLRLVLFEMIAFWAFADSTLGVVLADRTLPPYLPTLVGAAGALGLVLLGMAVAPAFLGFCRHYTEVRNRREKARYITTMALLPAIASSFVAPLFFLGGGDSKNFLKTLPLAGLFLIFTIPAAIADKTFYNPEIPPELRLSVSLLIGAGALYLWAQFLVPGLNLPPWDSDLRIVVRPPST